MKHRPIGAHLCVALTIMVSAAGGQANVLRANYKEIVAGLGNPVVLEVEPVAPATRACTFRVDDLITVIQFWHGRAHAISLYKADGSRITADELLKILREFSDGKDWDRDQAIYTRHDGQILGAWGRGNNFLLATAEFAVVVKRFPW